MEVPMQQLADQLARIEREVRAMRRELARLDRPPVWSALPLASMTASEAALAWADKGLWRESFGQVLVAQAITGQPLGATEIQRRLAQEGLGANELSQSLIAARDD